jgi:biotin carboxyl carrier protein
MTQDAEFSLRDAIDVLRLLDEDPRPAFDVRRDGFRLQCVRGSAAPPAQAQHAGENAAQAAQRRVTLRAPAAGRFYGDASVFAPAARPAILEAGRVVGRIEAGSRTTAVAADVDGTVVHACVAPGGFVEYGQALLVIEVA